MAEVEDAREAEDMVHSLYPNPLGPHPYDFKTYKQGFTWIVKYNVPSIMNVERHEVRINARTGNMVRIK
ncbi:hypothetical protein ES703_108593 [subsurface metagenome]